MANVELAKIRQSRDRGDIVVVQGVSGVELHAIGDDRFTGVADSSQFRLDIRVLRIVAMMVECVGIGSGVDFADHESTAGRGLDLIGLRIDECTDRQFAVAEGTDGPLEGIELPKDIQPTFGGDFLPTFGDEHGHVGPSGQGDLDQSIGGGHLQIQGQVDGLRQPLEIVILYMASILAEVGAGADEHFMGVVWMGVPAAGLRTMKAPTRKQGLAVVKQWP